MPVPLLNEDITKQIMELFDAQLEHPVEIIFFSKNDPCESCGITHQLLEEIASITDKVHLRSFNLDENPQMAQHYKVDLAPGFVITEQDGEKSLDFGLHFSGIPSGYEFSALVQGILLISKRDSGLKPEVRKELKNLTDPINLKVFVTPT